MAAALDRQRLTRRAHRVGRDLHRALAGHDADHEELAVLVARHVAGLIRRRSSRRRSACRPRRRRARRLSRRAGPGPRGRCAAHRRRARRSRRIPRDRVSVDAVTSSSPKPKLSICQWPLASVSTLSEKSPFIVPTATCALPTSCRRRRRRCRRPAWPVAARRDARPGGADRRRRRCARPRTRSRVRSR